MKKILWIAAAVVGLFAAASCQKETTAVPETEEAIAVLSVSVPQSIATKAYSDGKTATGVFAPYMPLVPTQLLGTPDGGLAQGFSTWYAKALLNKNLLVAGKIEA